jgi:hypothetical protein
VSSLTVGAIQSTIEGLTDDYAAFSLGIYVVESIPVRFTEPSFNREPENGEFNNRIIGVSKERVCVIVGLWRPRRAVLAGYMMFLSNQYTFSRPDRLVLPVMGKAKTWR